MFITCISETRGWRTTARRSGPACGQVCTRSWLFTYCGGLLFHLAALQGRSWKAVRETILPPKPKVLNVFPFTEKVCQPNLYGSKELWRRKWQPTPAFLPGKCQGKRSMAAYSLKSCKESDVAEHSMEHTGNGRWFRDWQASFREKTASKGPGF